MTQNKDIMATGFDRDNNITSAKNKKQKLNYLTTKILNKSVSCEQGMHPRLFCRRWFGLSIANKNGKPRFTEKQILAIESEHGYREKCINLISKLLKIKPNTIQRWGKGVLFNKIPKDKQKKYEIYLGYVDTIRVLSMSLKKLDEASLLKLLQELENDQSDKN